METIDGDKRDYWILAGGMIKPRKSVKRFILWLILVIGLVLGQQVVQFKRELTFVSDITPQ